MSGPSDADEAPEDAAPEPTPAAEAQDLSAAVLPVEASAEEAYGQRARLAEARLAEVLAAYRQLKADQQGQRERVTRAIERRYEQRHEKLLVKFIDVLDGFDRALEAAEQTYAGAPLIEGLILVRTQLLQTLRDEGLERIPVLGLPFDPRVSEAMGTEPVDDPDQNQVVLKEYQRGYRFREHLVRPSRVVVGQYAPQPDAEVVAAAAEPAAAPGPPAEEPEAAPPPEWEIAAAGRLAAGQPDRQPEQEAPPAQTVLPAYDHAEGLRPVPDVEGLSPEPQDVAAGAPALVVTPLTEEDGAPTVEEIVARAEKEDALPPQETPGPA